MINMELVVDNQEEFDEVARWVMTRLHTNFAIHDLTVFNRETKRTYFYKVSSDESDYRYSYDGDTEGISFIEK